MASSAAQSVQSVQRALELLTVFSARHPRLALKELAEAAGIPKPSAHRLARTLIENGFLEQAADGTYALGEQVVRLSAVATKHGAVERATADTARLMAHMTGQTVIVARANWVQCSTTITATLLGSDAHPGISRPGSRTEFSTGSIGKALLASKTADDARALVERMPPTRRTGRSLDMTRLLEEVARSRTTGWATSIDEFLLGVAGVAVPVVIGGHTVGAIAVVTPSALTSEGELDEWGRIMRNALHA